MAGTTTIQITKGIKGELDSLKDHERETYAGVIGRLIARNKQDEEAKLELSAQTLRAVKSARNDMRKGRVSTSAQVKKRLGL